MKNIYSKLIEPITPCVPVQGLCEILQGFDYSHLVNIITQLTPEQDVVTGINLIEIAKNENILNPLEPGYFLVHVGCKITKRSYRLILGSMVLENNSSRIIEHEATLDEGKKAISSLFAKHRIETEPVIVAYKSTEESQDLLKKFDCELPVVNAYQTKTQIITIYKIDDSLAEKVEDFFDGLESVYILDGHHRLNAARERNHQNILTYFVADNEAQLNGFYKIINGIKVNYELIQQLSCVFEVYRTQQAPTLNGNEVAFYARIENEPNFVWYKLVPVSFSSKPPPTFLQENVLAPFLNIQNPQNDKRLISSPMFSVKEFTHHVEKIEAVGFIYRPLTMAEFFRIVEKGIILPPKSTYFLPRTQGGVVFTNTNEILVINQ